MLSMQHILEGNWSRAILLPHLNARHLLTACLNSPPLLLQHFLGHILEGNWNGTSIRNLDTRLEERDVRDSLLPPFQACAAQAAAGACMQGRHSVPGCCVLDCCKGARLPAAALPGLCSAGSCGFVHAGEACVCPAALVCGAVAVALQVWCSVAAALPGLCRLGRCTFVPIWEGPCCLGSVTVLATSALPGWCASSQPPDLSRACLGLSSM